MALLKLHSLQNVLVTLAFALTLSTMQYAVASTEVATTYIVHMDLSVMPAVFTSHRHWYTATLTKAKSTIDPEFVYVYENAIHGFSTRLTLSQVENLKNLHGFLSCYPDIQVTMDTTHTPEFLHLNSISGLWPESNYGEDIIVGILDTGISPESKSYNDDGFTAVPSRWRGTCESGTAFSSALCNRKLIGARSFNKGLIASDPNITIAVNSPRDTDGHGTHTSSTAAGSYVTDASFFGYAPGLARGMAPHARVAMYKALWDEGAYASDIIAAIDQAISDGVDVMSMSLGLSGIPLYKDPIAIATFAAVEKGIFIATSAGNSGPDLGFLHNGTPWVLTVGGGTVDREYAGEIVLDGGKVVVGQSIYLGDPTSITLPLEFLGSCENYTLLEKARHKIVVCQGFNSLDFTIQIVSSSKVGAAIFIGNDPYIELFLHFNFPGTIVSPQDGPIIMEYINRSPNSKATLRFRKTILGSKPAPLVATYSSRGPTFSCPSVLKPDIIAPGSLIFASWARNSSVGEVGDKEVYGPFNIISGTSMACPHAAGVGALVKAARPGWSPAAIRSALMTTASNLDNTGAPIKDMGDKYQHATPLALGSGHIEPNKALEPGLVYDASSEDYVKLLCAMNFTLKQIKTITRKSALIDCSKASLDLNYPSFIAYFDTNKTHTDDNTVRKFQRTVTNVGDTNSTYVAKIMAIRGFSITVIPDNLVFERKYEKQSFEVILEGQIGKKVNEVLHGSLSWLGNNGKYTVRSPIVVTNVRSPFSL